RSYFVVALQPAPWLTLRSAAYWAVLRPELALARSARLASERNAVQDQQAHKNGRQRQTKHLCSRVLTCTKHLCSRVLICLCHDVDPCISIFVFSRERLERGLAVAQHTEVAFKYRKLT